MILVTGNIKFESEEELENVSQALVGRAQRSRKDAGCIAYTFSRNLEDSTEIVLTEKWESAELLQAHLEIPDKEFGVLLSTAKIATATIVSSEAGEEKILMQR